MTIAKTGSYSWCTGSLPEGCARCVEGRKLVLFITGLCAQRCFYCPVSEDKFTHDDVYANEWKIKDVNNPKELFEEARLTGATGAGVTGGDPLAQIDRCADYIRKLKHEFGKGFHIHLYTPLKLVTEERLKKLFDAGLDEIRFHPDLDDQSLWPRLDLAKKYAWKIGVEIPAIPGYEEKTKRLVDFIVGKVEFLNLNELERSDTQAAHYKLDEKGFEQKDRISYGIKGSKEMAFSVMEYANKKGLKAHFCTAKLKDAVQMTKRLQLRAQHTALPFDIQTKAGTLIHGVVYLHELSPGFDYQKRIAAADRERTIKNLESLKEEIKKIVKSEEVMVDQKKLRILLSSKLIRKHAAKVKALGLLPAIVEEFPTAEQVEVEVDFLRD